MTQLLTVSTVGLAPMHKRLTSVSQAARNAGVTWLGNCRSVAAAGTLPSKATTQARRKFMTTSVGRRHRRSSCSPEESIATGILRDSEWRQW
jgi:hypothetical protein